MTPGGGPPPARDVARTTSYSSPSSILDSQLLPMRLGGSRSALFFDTGQVEFRINALSRRADPGNLLVAAGFVLFGRQKQTKFARTACERMAQLTRAQLAEKRDSGRSRGFGSIRGMTLDLTARRLV